MNYYFEHKIQKKKLLFSNTYTTIRKMAQPNRNERKNNRSNEQSESVANFIYEAKLMWKQDVHYENILK